MAQYINGQRLVLLHLQNRIVHDDVQWFRPFNAAAVLDCRLEVPFSLVDKPPWQVQG